MVNGATTRKAPYQMLIILVFFVHNDTISAYIGFSFSAS